MVMKAYLDNNIISAIDKNDMPTESDALEKLLLLSDTGEIELVTSEVAL